MILAASLLLLFSINTLQSRFGRRVVRSLMAEVTQLKRYDAPRINWGKWFLIGTGVLVSAFILVVPMVYIFVQAFSKGLMPALENLANPDMLHAIWLTVLIALITVPVNLVFGTLLAWLVTRFNFPRPPAFTDPAGYPLCGFAGGGGPGLPAVLRLPTARWAAGWTSITCKSCSPGRAWCWVTVFVTCPFVVRELVPVMLSQGSHEDEAAVLLGASGWQMFRRVTLPNIRWALALWRGADQRPRDWRIWCGVGGVRLDPRRNPCRCRYRLNYWKQDYNTVGSFTAAALLTLMAILTLFLKSVVQWRLENQEKRQHQEGNHEH
ncbi:sulfate/thiosulfate transporter permease subunit [Enterobacter cancerogenus]|uniref:Sulfate/thiosulfate transporter permease subunit n=1 Tax=Enterobacter cancerogenus TaxID=69218 RepID=A0A484ZF45_9ENTR|nr:sulfate/thiosulfate transporter permease subunit [Enterobacter cancerogenus]